MSDRSVLVVVAHPDDEVLGSGGTIARHAALGEKVYVLFLTDGVGARGGGADQAAVRRSAAETAAKILGSEQPRFLSFPDNRLDAVDRLDVVQAIEEATSKLRPSTIYTHHAGDLNVDHQICHLTVLTAFRPLPRASVRRILAMEVASSTEWSTPCISSAFIPNHFVDIEDTLPRKAAALRAYAEEMRAFPHARSSEALEHLARWRGAHVGLRAAEAFMVIREIVR
jgi:LmbE family N-acetylglucosaminyl deacetylase